MTKPRTIRVSTDGDRKPDFADHLQRHWAQRSDELADEPYHGSLAVHDSTSVTGKPRKSRERQILDLQAKLNTTPSPEVFDALAHLTQGGLRVGRVDGKAGFRENGWTRIGITCETDRRAMWVRFRDVPDCGAIIELCGGREGDDYYCIIDPSNPAYTSLYRLLIAQVNFAERRHAAGLDLDE